MSSCKNTQSFLPHIENVNYERGVWSSHAERGSLCFNPTLSPWVQKPDCHQIKWGMMQKRIPLNSFMKKGQKIIKMQNNFISLNYSSQSWLVSHFLPSPHDVKIVPLISKTLSFKIGIRIKLYAYKHQ